NDGAPRALNRRARLTTPGPAGRRRRPPLAPTGDAPRVTVIVVARDVVAAARLEAMLRGDPRLRVAVCSPAELARRMDDCPALLLLVEPTPGLFALLHRLGDRPRAPTLIVLSRDPHRTLTTHARTSGIRAVLRTDATADELSAAIGAARAGLVTLHPDA